MYKLKNIVLSKEVLALQNIVLSKEVLALQTVKPINCMLLAHCCTVIIISNHLLTTKKPLTSVPVLNLALSIVFACLTIKLYITIGLDIFEKRGKRNTKFTNVFGTRANDG